MKRRKRVVLLVALKYAFVFMGTVWWRLRILIFFVGCLKNLLRDLHSPRRTSISWPLRTKNTAPVFGSTTKVTCYGWVMGPRASPLSPRTEPDGGCADRSPPPTKKKPNFIWCPFYLLFFLGIWCPWVNIPKKD